MILINNLSVEDINSALLRLQRQLNTETQNLESKVTTIVSGSSKSNNNQYDDSSIRILIDSIQREVKKNIGELETSVRQTTEKMNKLLSVIANIDCAYDSETNTLYFTNSEGQSKQFLLKDTTYTFSFDETTQTLTIHDDTQIKVNPDWDPNDPESPQYIPDDTNDFVQQITGTTYTFTWNNGTLTIHNNLAGTNTAIDFDARYYTESEIDAFVSDINQNITNLTGRVTTIEGKIPSAASSTNQLADKEYVNHSISTATATFRGTVETTSALAALTGDLNDYAFLKVYDATTHSYSYDRYKWVESGGDYGHWLYEYSIENTEFTAPQWEALNSGITCSLVDKITDVYNAKITLCQGGTCKGSFTLNQSNNQTISLDDHTVCAHSSTNLNTDLPLLACCSSSTGILGDAYFSPNVAVNTCCGRLTACYFCFKKGGCASRILSYVSKNYTGGTRCTSMDIRMFMECFSKCHCLSSGEQLDVKYPWADACNNIVCWGTNSSINLTGASVTILSNSYNSTLWNDSCSGWTDFSVRIQPRNGVAHTFTAYKGSSSAVAATIVCDNNYDYLSYRAYNVRKLGVSGNVDYKLLLGDDSSEFASPYYSCGCQVTFNPSTGLLQIGNVCVNASLASQPAIAKDVPLSCQNTAFLLTKASNCVDNCSLGVQIGSGNVNRGFFDYGGTSGNFRWLTYYNATCEVHNLPQSFGCTSKSISIPTGTTYVLLGCICPRFYTHGTKLGVTVGGNNVVNEAELDMLLTSSLPDCFECNNINVKVSNFSKSRYGIAGIGFISTNPASCTAWNCPVCVVLQVCNVSSGAHSWCFDVFGLRTNCWTTDIQCLGSTAPTFTKLISIPACCRSYTYSNASQDITGNVCGTLNGCGIADIVNDSVACAYSGLGASLNGIDFTKNDGVLTLDDFSFDKVCDACTHNVFCGDVVRRIIETNQISGVGYRQRIGLGLDRYQEAWGYGLLSIGINDAGTCFTDFRFSCSGGISSRKSGTAQCITLCGYSTDNVYRCLLPPANGNCAACATYIQIAVTEQRSSVANSLHLTFFGMMADLNLENSVNYYCGGYYGNLKFSRCPYTCSNCNCFWLSYCGYRGLVLCSGYKFTVLQCVKGTAPTGVTFSCFCDIVTAGVSGIQSIDLNGSSFTVSDGAATLDLTPDICYDTGTSKMCVILGNQTSTEVDLSSLASDHLVAYCGLCSSYDRPLLTGPNGLTDSCICKVYYSCGCPITFNACTGLLKITGAVCASNGLCTGSGRVSWGYSKVDVGGRASIRLFYDITQWANGTTGTSSRGLSGTFTHYRCNGYGVGWKSDVVMTANYGRNNASWSCNNTGCIKLLYDYVFGLADRPLILYDSATCKYWLGLCSSTSSGHTIRFDGIWSGAPETTCTLCYDANGCLPTGWTICTCGVRNFTNRCINVYCGTTCKCNITPSSPLCLSANAFNQYAEVDENTYPGVCCTGDVNQAEIADFITMADVDACGFMKNFCVYCGSTCKCKISNAGCLKLCANAFNANAQISTTTYPGACCTGTIRCISINGQDFSVDNSGNASLSNFYPVCLCQWCTDDKSLVLTDKDNHIGYSCGCPIEYNQCTGCLWACILRSCCINFAPKANTNGCCSIIRPVLSSKTIEFITGDQGWCCTGCFGTCRLTQSNGYSYFKADRICGDLGCLCCVYSDLICSTRYENQCICCSLTFTCDQYVADYVLLGCTCAICNYKNIDTFVYAIHNNGVADKDNMVCVTFQPASIATSCINNLKIAKSGSRSAPVRIQGIGYINNGNGTYCWVAQLRRGTTSTANVSYCNLLYLNKVNTLFNPSIQHLDSEPTFTCFIPFSYDNETYDNGAINLPNLTARYKYVCCCTGPSNDGCSGAAILITFCGSSVGFTKDIILRVKSTDENNHDEYSTTYLSVLNGYPNAYCGSLNGCVSYNMPGYGSYITHIVEGVGFAVSDGCPQIVVSVCKCAATQLVFDVYEAKDVTCGGCVTAPAGNVTSAICCLEYENDSTYLQTLKQFLSCWTALGSYNTTGTNFASTLNTNMVLTCCVSTTSDVRCKKNILPFNNGINILKCTDIIQYNYIGENDNCVPHVGIPANWSCQLLSGKDQNTFRVNDALGVTMDAVKDLISSMTLGQKIKLWLIKKFKEVKRRKELINKINKYKGGR